VALRAILDRRYARRRMGQHDEDGKDRPQANAATIQTPIRAKKYPHKNRKSFKILQRDDRANSMTALFRRILVP
jgi:hypothetical protein